MRCSANQKHFIALCSLCPLWLNVLLFSLRLRIFVSKNPQIFGTKNSPQLFIILYSLEAKHFLSNFYAFSPVCLLNCSTFPPEHFLLIFSAFYFFHLFTCSPILLFSRRSTKIVRRRATPLKKLSKKCKFLRAFCNSVRHIICYRCFCGRPRASLRYLTRSEMIRCSRQVRQ